EMALERKTLFYLGAQANWRDDPHFARVRFSEIYPGIDLAFATNSGQLEYSFEVAARADPRTIRIRYEGARVSLARSGDLEIDAPGVRIVQQRPRAFQSDGDRERPVACRYIVASSQEVTLDMGAYDASAALTIDPTLTFSTYIGGSGFDTIYAVATDSSGNLYVAGETASGSLWNNSLPARSSRDAFIAKLNSTATQVLYTVYLGGSGNDSARGIATDTSGGVYVVGVTGSANFPVTTGAFATTGAGIEDAFVAKLDPTGRLLYSTYLGGTTADFALAIAVDPSGAAYVAGQTESPLFPATPGALQQTYRGGISDCFVSKLNATGSALIYSTFLGGLGLDLCAGIAVDPAGNAYVTGTTYSADFPTQIAFQTLRGTANAFVSKINATGSALVYSTFLGGTNFDQGYAIALDSTGSAYITGSTASIDFPATAGAFQNRLRGAYNAFVSRLSADGSSLIYSTLIGGSNSDTATSIALDKSGRAVVGGYTSSPDFPTVAAVQSVFQGGFDAFASVLDPPGASLVLSSYFGGSGDDRGYAVAVAPAGQFYLAGFTASANFPTVAAVQPGLNVAYDAFLLEVSGISVVGTASLNISKTHSGSFAQGQQNASYTVAVSNAANASPTSGAVTVTETLPSGLTLVSMAGPGWSCSANTCSRNDGLFGGESYPAITVTVNLNASATSPQLNLVSVSGGGSAAATTTDSTTIVAALLDLAQNKSARQSSTFSSLSNASNAVDGNTDGSYADGSLSTTNLDANAWWQVDLGVSASVTSIVVWNRTDCCGDRLSDYWVFVSDTPFGPTDTPATLLSRAGTWSSHQTVKPNPGTTVSTGAQGRYVRVQLSGSNYLSLAEVQVYGTLAPDLATVKSATQSSTFSSLSNASNAVDGNTDGSYADGSLSTTNLDANAWWQVDLGASASVSSIVVWNRTDCCGDRLSDYWVFVSDTPFGPTDTPATLQNRAGTWSSHQTVKPNPGTTVSAGAQGRYVRVQLSGSNYLSLAEVQVFGQ
ncbi:MAG TPA: SBBP repeat-containing protein, partial [Bryobacteraceae bacterium]|nr:SBBP repeat-containing protein [Bryobacteraceae bacterium]